MKKTFFALGASLLLVLGSCGSSDSNQNSDSTSVATNGNVADGQAGSTNTANNDRTIKAQSTDFTSGGLARYIEVVDEPAVIRYKNQDQYTQYIRVDVPIKLVKDGFENVDYRDISLTGLLSVACIELLDEEGEETTPGSLSIADSAPLKKLLTQKEGATDIITFEGRYGNPDSENWYKKTVSFKPTLTADIQVKSQD